MLILAILLCTVPTILAKECQQEKLKYSVTKLRSNYTYVTTVEEGTKILNKDQSFSIKVEDNVPVLCKGSLDITAEIYHLYIDKKHIEEIEPGTFENQTITSQLRISDNPITIIKAGTFKNLPITELDLSYNKISVIEENAIVNLPHITNIYLSRNQIKEFHPNSIVGTPKLLFFDLTFNKMQKLQDNLFSFMTKEQPVGIGVGVNELTEVSPKAFANIKVWNLNLTHNKIAQLPKEVFTENDLKMVDLEHNELSELNDELFRRQTVDAGFFRGNKLNCPTLKKIILYKEVTGFYRMYFDKKEECFR